MDPYIYPQTNVLINKLNIRDEAELINVETQLLIAGIIDISSIVHKIDFKSYESLQIVHRFLFQELYSWAGEFRSVNIYKSERVLNGLSVTYSDKDHIVSDLISVFNWSASKKWDHSSPNLSEDFSAFMTKLWRIHPYREGNTRTISIFMELFSEANELDFNAPLLSRNSGYLREALVLSAVEEAPEPKYLVDIIKDALQIKEHGNLNIDNETSSNYQVIEQHDVTKYEERPFKTNLDQE